MKAIAKESVDAWVELLTQDATVFVPQRRAGGDVILAPLAQGNRTEDYIRLGESPKRILMPQVEDLVQFDQGRGKAVLDQTPRILFGLRPCDAAAIAILDEFFTRDVVDPSYAARRKHMRLIVTACAESPRTGSTCSCLTWAKSNSPKQELTPARR